MVNIAGFDYDNFDPEGVTYPPNGNYTLAIIGSEDKPSKDGHRMINVHFEIASGVQSKQQFRIGYYVGNPNVEQAKWAFEALGRLYYGVTGQRPTSRGFDLEQLKFKAFEADFDATPNAKGDKFPKIKNLKPLGATNSAQPQQGYAATAATSNYNQAPAQGTPAPSWGAPR